MSHHQHQLSQLKAQLQTLKRCTQYPYKFNFIQLNWNIPDFDILF
jgi:hypothetical protein